MVPTLEVSQIVKADEAIALIMNLHDRAVTSALVKQDGVEYVEARSKLEQTLRVFLDAAPVSQREFLNTFLKTWKNEGIPAPVNELQSIAAWLRESVNPTSMKEKMRKRMLLLEAQAIHLNGQGPDAEDRAGIYDNRPDLKP